MFFFVLFFEFIEFLTIFLSVILFFIIFWRNPINTLIYNHFKKLSFKNKIFFAWFTLFFAIPNKIMINNKIPNFLTGFVLFLITVVSYVFPFFIVFYILFWINVMESYFFAVLYEGKKFFKDFLDTKLFENNQTFSKDYFSFFWGNMPSAATTKGRTGILTTIISGLYTMARYNEKAQLRERTQLEFTQHTTGSVKKFATPSDSLNFQKELENHIIDRDLVILSAEKIAKNALKNIVDSIIG